MKYVPTIGLEIHAELRTRSKMFCPCVNDPDEEKPNVNICPICLGHPGTLPVLNKEAIAHVLRVGIAVGGTIADFTEWDRKQYFYPDIPKGYQISQYKYPLVSDGGLSGVALERLHLEEDTARSTHDIEVGPRGPTSLVDFNRSGVPLMELVTKPVIHDAKTAVIFAKELQLLLRYMGAGEANLEKGEMRVEANISVASPDDTNAGRFGVKTEVKNLNSFRSVERAIEYEVERQIALTEKGEKVIQETRGWDDNQNETYSQRSKESSHDYRYFPDPDIPKMKLSEIPEFSHASMSKDMPELPWTKRERFARDFGMTDKEVAVFVELPVMANYFETVTKPFEGDSKKIRLAINYILNDYVAILKSVYGNDYLLEINRIKPEDFSELIALANTDKISSRGVKDLMPKLILRDMAEKGQLEKYAADNDLLQKSDAADISPAIDKVVADNQKAVDEYKTGKTAALQFLIGQVMKATKGTANPAVISELLVKKLG